MDAKIKSFLEELLAKAGMADLDPEVKEQMIQDLNSSLEDKLTLTVLENLSPERAKELEELTDRNAAPEEIQDFLTKNVANLDKIYAEAMEDFAKLYLDGSQS